MNTQFRFKCTLTVDQNHILNTQDQTKQINKRNYLLIHTPRNTYGQIDIKCQQLFYCGLKIQCITIFNVQTKFENSMVQNVTSFFQKIMNKTRCFF